MNLAWIGVIATFLGVIWPLIQMGKHFDEENDPRTIERKEQLGKWLVGQGSRSLESRLQATSETFLYLFDRLFSGKGSPLERGLWMGLLLASAVLLAVSVLGRADFLQGGDLSIPSPQYLMFALALAFSFSFGFVVRKRLSQIGGIVILVTGFFVCLAGVLISSLISDKVDNDGGVLVFGLVVGLVGGLVSDKVNGIGGVLVFGLVIGFLGGLVSVLGVALDVVDIDPRVGLVGVLVAVFVLGILNYFEGEWQVSVDPLKALSSSLIFIISVSLITMSTDAAVSFVKTITPKMSDHTLPTFIALNIFADGISLLETRWVLQQSRKGNLLILIGLAILDLAASATIFLFLPTALGEVCMSYFWDGVLFHGDRPWLGILFWSTFGTSFIFYAFLIAVFLFLLPGHGIATTSRRLIQKFIGPFSTIEERPFTSIAYALSAVCVLLAGATGIAALVTSLCC